MSFSPQDIPGERFRSTVFQVVSPGAPSQEQRTKLGILLAAASLFAQKGYNGTAVREIVEVAGVTKPTLYYYFKNKDDLYYTLMDSAFKVFSQVIEESARRPGSMRERLIGLFSSIFELLRENVDLVRFINSIAYGPRGATPEYDLEAMDAELLRIFSEILKTGEAEGELAPEDHQMVLTLLYGLFCSLQSFLFVEPASPILSQLDIPRLIHLVFDGARTTSHQEAIRL